MSRPEEPWRSLRDAYHLLRRRWTEILEGFELSVSEYVVLDLCRGAPARASEIARAVGLTPAGATDIIDRLERRRLVRRLAHPRDRRAVQVALTPAGRRIQRDARLTVWATLRELDAQMLPRERRALTVGLAALHRVLLGLDPTRPR